MNPSDAAERAARRLLRRLLREVGSPAVRVRFHDGEVVEPEVPAVATFALHDRGALLRLLLDPELQVAELLAQGRASVEGDLVAMLTALMRGPAPSGLASWLRSWRGLGSRFATRASRSARNAQHHYDVSNEFYALWLDERMVYTCAYYPSPEASLEDAQLAKLDHVCRKLALRPGDRVIEAGCGWGALALHMARYYGCRVRAWNVSEQQVAFARERAEKEGLSDRVEFVLDDYRSIDGTCDAFVSVGMLEHVGRAHYRTLGAVIDRCLAPEGRGLVHTIGRSRPQRLNRWTEKNVFPNAHPPTLREMMEIFEPNGLVVLDVENLRRHYARTVRHWLGRFREQRSRAEALVGERLVRVFELYLAGTIASFEASTIELFQVVFTRVGNDAIPWTRSHVYTAAEDPFGRPATPGGA